ncbi:Puf4 [Kluyveromyces lactis]|nr:Puf4 [Kluyveromyces lactis]
MNINPVSVPETINAALGQLHLDDVVAKSNSNSNTQEPDQETGNDATPIAAATETISNDRGNGNNANSATTGGTVPQQLQQQEFFMGDSLVPGPSGPGPAPMFAPHMMNPFMPYHPMMHMPHSGFFPGAQDQMFPPPDSSAAVDFNLSLSPSGGSVVPGAGNMTGGVNDPAIPGSDLMMHHPQQYMNHNGQRPVFWMNPDLNSSAIDDTTAGEDPQNQDSFVRGASFTLESSEQGNDAKVPGANTSRRQTFHAVSATDLLNNSTSSPTETTDATGTNASATSPETSASKKEMQERVYPQAAAYPYTGALLQPNPVLSGHPLGHHPHPIGSPFPGYGFNTAFSPVPGPTNTLNAGSPAISADGKETNNSADPSGQPNRHIHSGTNSPGLNQPGSLPMSGPNPWMFAAPHGSPNFLVPHPHHPGHAGPPAGHQRPQSNNSQHRKRHFNNNGSSRNNLGNMKPHGKPQRFEDGSRYQDAILEQFVGSIYSLCKDQHGCRFLQRQLDENGEAAASTIYSEIKDHICELMNDPFGNYLMQKLFERINQRDRVEIVKNCSPQFMDIALDAHGTRALQKLVECTDTEEETQILVASLQPSILSLSRDFKSNHVVQKMLEKFSNKDTQFIYDAACDDIIKISNHRNGCCVVQRCLDFGNTEQLDALCDKIVEKSFELTMNPYGNYVIQYILTKEKDQETPDFKYTKKIVDVLKFNAIDLSLNKFGSNVVESILRTPAVSDVMTTKILNSNDESGLLKLLHDSYGNYVLQTALDIVKDSNASLFSLLSDSLKPLLVGQIRNTPHGRRIAALLQAE